MNTDILELKKQLRKDIRERKKAVDKQKMLQDSEKIFEIIERIPDFVAAKTVLAYWSLPDEVYTHDFIMKWYKEKKIVLPLVVGETLDLKFFSGHDCMEAGISFGILEPHKGEDANLVNIDFGIIPGMAFDLKGNRMGRGKGYYDKLFKQKKMYKVGVCFDFQIVDSVPTDEYDVSMDLVVSTK